MDHYWSSLISQPRSPLTYQDVLARKLFTPSHHPIHTQQQHNHTDTERDLQQLWEQPVGTDIKRANICKLKQSIESVQKMIEKSRNILKASTPKGSTQPVFIRDINPRIQSAQTGGYIRNRYADMLLEINQSSQRSHNRQEVEATSKEKSLKKRTPIFSLKRAVSPVEPQANISSSAQKIDTSLSKSVTSNQSSSYKSIGNSYRRIEEAKRAYRQKTTKKNLTLDLSLIEGRSKNDPILIKEGWSTTSKQNRLRGDGHLKENEKNFKKKVGKLLASPLQAKKKKSPLKELKRIDMWGSLEEFREGISKYQFVRQHLTDQNISQMYRHLRKSNVPEQKWLLFVIDEVSEKMRR